MNLSFQEKSIAGSLAATIFVYANYFGRSLQLWLENTPDDHAVARLVGTITLLVVIEVIYQIVIAIAERPAPKDERDRFIDAKANRNAYAVLVIGLAHLIGGVLIAEGVSYQNWSFLPLTPFLLAQAALAALIVAEVVKGVTQLYYYRAGV
jgi:H+/gluconate symporter-like permease